MEKNNGHLEARLHNIEASQERILVILGDLRERSARVETKIYMVTAAIAFVVATGRDLVVGWMV